MKRSTCHGCPALNGDGTCTIIAEGRKITITPDMEQGCCAAPVRHGKWVEDHDYLRCPNCSVLVKRDFTFFDLGEWNYCPNCGAKMDTEETKWH